mgnify:FL=1
MENEETASSDGMDGFLSDLANAIPGIDEAMSFAEMLKYVFLKLLLMSWASTFFKHLLLLSLLHFNLIRS